ncbi:MULTISPECIES: sigma 54-interacting transcriptional regulator [unclassified Brenneria]|uniref:sigma 54-interacting transcriptional regulator n=1 Tax=unclassified Brenneria TaxID=2634434 RepID=UPI0029C239E2|nr:MULTISPECIES: sigma 54-interacting transcriptional regulator [unclassified Brenneria]MDX5626667.1 sigma 54-interacting transcriptional regulator [Brenneria sp. L3-3Z]MDX5693983.1 sigma 54-interacting transcriptional regulator [Brenneria sp. L4-2C]MEE3661376.1 sigma 54-interacting transcriptional regulator [Brenneria sp. g21c3]
MFRKNSDAYHWAGSCPEFASAAYISEDIHATLSPLVDVIAPLSVDIVLEGETGTGKDRLARRIHQLSGCSGPLVAVNCAAIPESLAESELFGVVSGAYTGASRSRAGYVESADKGILFLDEIDSMPLMLQAKMLRVLENRGVERLGSTLFKPLDMRVIVATQTPLNQLVDKGLFRRDLYFRLDTVKIQLPTLRSRTDLIVPMFQRFCNEAAQRLKVSPPAVTTHLYERLLAHAWPGNIRELKAAAERWVLGLSPLASVAEPAHQPLQLKDRMRRIEKFLIQDAMRRHGHCIDRVVTELGIPKRTLYHRLKVLNVSAR